MKPIILSLLFSISSFCASTALAAPFLALQDNPTQNETQSFIAAENQPEATATPAIAAQFPKSSNPLAYLTSRNSSYVYTSHSLDPDTTRVLALVSAICAFLGFLFLSGLSPLSLYAAGIRRFTSSRKQIVKAPVFLPIEEDNITT